MGTRPFTFADTFEVVADTVPDKTAIVTEERRLTYAEVDERATRLAHVLAKECGDAARGSARRHPARLGNDYSGWWQVAVPHRSRS